MISRRTFGHLTIGALGASAIAAPALATTKYPERPIKLVVGYSPGTTTDTFARLAAEKLSQRLGQPVMVENRVGAGSLIAYDYVSKQAPDGYTLSYVGSNLPGVNYVLAKPLFDPYKDFTWIAPAKTIQMVVLVHGKLPVKSMEELVALIRSKPGELKFGSYGVASTNNFKMQALLKALGLSAVHVPYRDAGQLYMDIARGDIQFMIDGMGPQQSAIKSGAVRVMAICSTARHVSLPNIPTVAETVLPGFQLTPFHGFAGPAHMPAALVAQLNREINAVLLDPVVVANGETTYSPCEGGTPAKLEAWIKFADEEYKQAVALGIALRG